MVYYTAFIDTIKGESYLVNLSNLYIIFLLYYCLYHIGLINITKNMLSSFTLLVKLAKC